MPRFAATLPIAFLLLSLTAAVAGADRRYFVDARAPYLLSAENLELELWTIAHNGRGDSTNTAWQNRAEFEYGLTDRLTGAFYLNFIQAGESGQVFDGPSFELIYAFGAPGTVPLDPAVYLEVRANGEEVEVEPKLLLGHRAGPVVAAFNVIGEFEKVHGEDETEKVLEIAAGVTREFGTRVALGVEGIYTREFAGTGSDPSAFFAGPTLNLQSGKVQLAIGWHPQISGSPSSSGSRNLADFDRSQVRLILGVDL